MFFESNELIEVALTKEANIMVESKLNPEALENYSKSFSTIILDDFFDKNEAISGQEIVNLTSIKQLNFFVLKVLFSQWQEETKKFRSPYFDYNNESVKNALKSLVNTLSKHISIEREAFSPIFERAIRDTLILIYDPKNFFQNEVRSLSDTNYISSFKSLSKYIKTRRDAFDKISMELDEGNIEKGSVELEDLIYKSVEHLEIDEVREEIDKFNEILVLEILEPVQIVEPDVKDTIQVADSDDLPSPDVKEEESEGIEEEAKEESNMNEEFEPVHGGEPKLEKQEVILPEEPIEKIDHVNINEQFAEETQTLNDQFDNESKPVTVSEKMETEKVSELHSSISVNQRYMFLSDLFDNDVNEYNNAIDSIEKCESFDESVEHLMQNYSRKYQWDMASDEVKELLKVIFKKFR